MNALHRWYCNSNHWARTLQGRVMPAALRGLDLGDAVLEVGPGPGKSTEWLRARVPHITAIEIDERLATQLDRRMEGTNVTVIHGDACAIPSDDASSSGAVSFTMLHHVPASRQDALLREVARVLRPGGVFTGTDSTPGFLWNVFHIMDDRYPVDPLTFGARLEAAGFRAVHVRVGRGHFFWTATRADALAASRP